MRNESAIKFLEENIPFEQLKGYISFSLLAIEGAIQVREGIYKGAKNAQAFMNKNYVFGIFHLVIGGVLLVKGFIDLDKARIDFMKNKYEKKSGKLKKILIVY